MGKAHGEGKDALHRYIRVRTLILAEVAILYAKKTAKDKQVDSWY